MSTNTASKPDIACSISIIAAPTASTSKAVVDTNTSTTAPTTSATTSNHHDATSVSTIPKPEQLNITLEPYTGEHQMASLISLIESELSEPYIVYTYRYFVNQWPDLCFLAYTPSASATPPPSNEKGAMEKEAIGVIVCKIDRHPKGSRLFRGYIAMISVSAPHRGRGLAKTLVCKAIEEMVGKGAQEIVLETEVDNVAALGLYEGLGFVREKRLHRFYLNGKDSFRLVLPIPKSMQKPIAEGLDRPPPTGLVQPPYPTPVSRPQELSTQHLTAQASTNDYII